MALPSLFVACHRVITPRGGMLITSFMSPSAYRRIQQYWGLPPHIINSVGWRRPSPCHHPLDWHHHCHWDLGLSPQQGLSPTSLAHHCLPAQVRHCNVPTGNVPAPIITRYRGVCWVVLPARGSPTTCSTRLGISSTAAASHPDYHQI